MGSLTTVAGAIEVFSSLNAEQINNAVNDGKEIVNIVKKTKNKELDSGE